MRMGFIEFFNGPLFFENGDSFWSVRSFWKEDNESGSVGCTFRIQIPYRSCGGGC